MGSENNAEANEALCQVYAFLLQRRCLRLAQEAQSIAEVKQQAQSTVEKPTNDDNEGVIVIAEKATATDATTA